MELSKITAVLINTFFNAKKNFIDFAGGYGMLVRMMRDFGYSFFRQDKYCENTFAKYFDVTDQKEIQFELLTAFEVFEHLENPLNDIDEMLGYSNNILFSTILQPHDQVNPSNWWYISPEIGQHIALYHQHTLENIAKQKGLNFYTNGKNLHLFTKRKINSYLFKLISNKKVANLIFNLTHKESNSLTQLDYNFLKNKIHS
jgi:2-polyprenyl-3-methyl-5-hydroxy-6-metoxy-1,4-benzoquinol methylase